MISSQNKPGERAEQMHIATILAIAGNEEKKKEIERLRQQRADLFAVALDFDRLSLVIESAVRCAVAANCAEPRRVDEVAALLKANRAAIARAKGEGE